MAWLQRWLATGLSAALIWGGLTARSPARRGDAAVALWICDREEQALVGVSDRGLRVTELGLDYPRRVETTADGALWVLCGRSAGAQAATALVALTREGAERRRVELQGVVDLAGGRDGELLVLLAAGAGAWLERIAPDGTRSQLRACSDRARISSSASGRCWLLDLGRLSCWDSSARPEHTVAMLPGLAASRLEGFVWVEEEGWVLARTDSGRAELWHLTTAGAGARVAELGELSGPVRLAPSTSGTVWVVSEPGRALRFDAGGVQRGAGELPMLGIEAVAPGADGGCWALSGGALMRLDVRGERLPGQGGFRFAADLARAARGFE